MADLRQLIGSETRGVHYRRQIKAAVEQRTGDLQRGFELAFIAPFLDTELETFQAAFLEPFCSSFCARAVAHGGPVLG